MFCKTDQEFLCNSCIPAHFDHFDKLTSGTNKDIINILDKAYTVLETKNKEIGARMRKI